MTEINLRDENAKLEFTLDCDLENGLLRGWTVTCIDPLPLQMAFNVPFLSRPAGASSPCAQKAAAAEVPGRKAIRIGPDGMPIERR